MASSALNDARPLADTASDADTASQRSISLSSPPASPRQTSSFMSPDTATVSSRPAPWESNHYGDLNDALSRNETEGLHDLIRRSLDDAGSSQKSFSGEDASMVGMAISDDTSEPDTNTTNSGWQDRDSFVSHDIKSPPFSPTLTSPAPSFPLDESGAKDPSPLTTPIPVPTSYDKTAKRATTGDETASIFSTSSKASKARPDSLIIDAKSARALVLGIAVVDFNHLVGPQIEFSQGDVFEDEEIAKILPFLALPDGAHLNAEDFSYFHLVPSGPNPTTIFGISCNRQISAADLVAKDADVTRSTVQKAIVVLASKPIFGPIRDKLGVVTRAFFNQRDFRETGIIVDFFSTLEASVRSQMTESGLYMGTSLRELVHTFRQRTLILLKALILQKRIMFYGHPVEKLGTYLYSLISLVPGLLQTLDDCGSPPLANRAPTLSRPTELKTSERRSLLAYLGLPLDLFGQDAFFQPYLPLQQVDMLKTKSWLCGTTNSIVTQQKELDLLVNIEMNTFEFRDPKLERLVGLTAADRKWMDELVKDVNEGWNEKDPQRPLGMQFKGSDDYLRTKFEEYISAALSSIKYADFLAKGDKSGVLIPGGDETNDFQHFNEAWLSAFRETNAYGVWNRVTDPMLFDIVEPKHPCPEKPTAVADISLRLQEGIHELKLEEQLAPTREAISNAFATGSTNFFKAVEGARAGVNRIVAQRAASSASSTSPTTSTLEPPKEAEKSAGGGGLRPLSLLGTAKETKDSTAAAPAPAPAPATTPASGPAPAAQALAATASAWGSNIGSFFASRAPRFSMGGRGTGAAPPVPDKDPADRAPETK